MTRRDLEDTILARSELLASLRDDEYRRAFVAERVRSSMALQIRALREQRHMSQANLGEVIGMAQTWVSKLENPDYGKMTVATLLRLADAFDTDLEIKFRPFSTTLDTLPRQSSSYFNVPSFGEEFLPEQLSKEDEEKAFERQSYRQPLAGNGSGLREDEEKAFERQSYQRPQQFLGGSALAGLTGTPLMPLRKGAASETMSQQYAAR